MDADCEYPSDAVRVLVEARAGAWNRRAPNVVEWSDDEDGEQLSPAFEWSAAERPRLLELMEARRDERDDAKPSDGRGGYSREAKGKEAGSGYAKDAWTHFKQAEEFALGRPCLATCPYDRKCGLHMTPAHLLRAHIQMYGDNTTMQEPSEPGRYARPRVHRACTARAPRCRSAQRSTDSYARVSAVGARTQRYK